MTNKWGDETDDESHLREDRPQRETTVRLFLLLAAALTIVVAAGGVWFFAARRAMTERMIAVIREREAAQSQKMQRDAEKKRVEAAGPQAP